MKMKPIILVPVTEIARRGKKCDVTFRRHLNAAGIEPDAIMVQAGKSLPLYVEPRVKLILKLLSKKTIKL